MNKNRTLSIILIAILISALVLCGTVLAYMFRQTEYKDNQFTPANVSCEVLETFDGEKKSSIQVKNTGNIDAYLRVKFVSYWVDTEGNIMAKASVMPEITMSSGWIKETNNTYYYQEAVAPDKPTSNLLSSPIILEEDENGYLQVVEVFAEAIQSKPRDAVTSSWNVTLDSNSKIVE